ncbi:hypothetical protein QQ045_008109 [Rhodiola kirilowii]
MESTDTTQKARRRHHRRGLKICCGLTIIVVVILIIIFVTLAFTVFKPKDPEISARAVGIQNIQFSLFPKLSLNATLDMEVTIKNRNYGSFEYENTTAIVDYHGEEVAEFPMDSRNVPARGQISLRALVSVQGDKLVSNPFFMGDVGLGSLNFTSNSALRGKVSVFKVVKFKATAYSACHISVFIESQNVISTCTASIKM